MAILMGDNPGVKKPRRKKAESGKPAVAVKVKAPTAAAALKIMGQMGPAKGGKRG